MEHRKSVDMRVKLAGLTLDNPVIAASGTVGFGREFSQYVDWNGIGGISVKGLTRHPREGNPPARIVETPGGILNSVGLQNPGVEAFVREEIPFLRQFRTKIIANVAGSTVEEYEEMAEILEHADVDALEVNVSCPNVKAGCVAFGSSASLLGEVTKRVRARYSGPLLIKLTPNVTSITEMARAAEANGADGVSLINTLLGMAIDVYRREPVLANGTGGLSGPAVKPVAVRMVYEVCRAVSIPVVGMGGISTGEDAAEFLLAGAAAVMVGTANLVTPTACADVVRELQQYMETMKFASLEDFRGKVREFA